MWNDRVCSRSCRYFFAHRKLANVSSLTDAQPLLMISEPDGAGEARIGEAPMPLYPELYELTLDAGGDASPKDEL